MYKYMKRDRDEKDKEDVREEQRLWQQIDRRQQLWTSMASRLCHALRGTPLVYFLSLGD
jgi:hypothetical protein